MNKQRIKIVNGRRYGGLEWVCPTVHVDNILQMIAGYTFNDAFKGCFHGCEFLMADETLAQCYASRMSESTTGYEQGFAHAYWNAEGLKLLDTIKEPAGIFPSMGDPSVMTDEQVQLVLDTFEQKKHLILFWLTKNVSQRWLKFRFPKNVWFGVSMPPTLMNGNEVNQTKYLDDAARLLGQVQADITWMSMEPLTIDMGEWVGKHHKTLKWVVVGALADDWNQKHQPYPAHLFHTLAALDAHRIPVFYKGNMEAEVWREEFPEYHIQTVQPRLF